MTLKNTLCLSSIATIALALSACGGADEASSASSNVTKETAAASEEAQSHTPDDSEMENAVKKNAYPTEAAALATEARLKEAAPTDRPDIRAAAYAADPMPYDVDAKSMAEVEAALALAKAEDKNIIIKMGGNWCPDCKIMSGQMEIPAAKAWLEEHFVVVKVDIGRYDKNLDIPARFGVTEVAGAPTILIIDADGNQLNLGDMYLFRNARDRNPQDVVDYFHKYI